MECVHFHVRVRVKNLTKYFFAIFCAEMLQQFSPAIRLLTSFVFLQQSEILYWENKLDKGFRELNKIKIVIRVELLVKESDTVTLLIISVVFRYLQINFLSLLSYPTLKGPSQPHLCFCLHARIWLLYFIRSLSKRRKITVELLEIIKHTFWKTAYSKTIRIRFTMLSQ